MAGGSFAQGGLAMERAGQFQRKVTAYLIIACFVAAIGGSIFGYDIGISVLGLGQTKRKVRRVKFRCRMKF
ncbi:hypothetical protein TIFTF001_016365 [Ficus carica]|uniref:Uncharacterized protein n=1 Tax=Ficus carica TaxID=3494 RepID=A0AA88D8P4_FICCA|nr:hypothetical protein TIFTF001_016365 [Ficus carica]